MPHQGADAVTLPVSEASDTLYCHCLLSPSQQRHQLGPPRPELGAFTGEGTMVVILAPMEAGHLSEKMGQGNKRTLHF